MSEGNNMMAAVLDPEGVHVRAFEIPTPGPNDVLTRVRACGLNRADLLVASGRVHGSMGGAGTRLGMEWSGDVVAVGVDVEGFAPGDRVMGAGAAGWAEYALSDWRRTVRIPDNNMDYAQAASLGIALVTMHDAIVTNGGFRKGQSILIQGASSGVGILGMQIAKVLGASLVIGSSTDAERRGRLVEFGADLAIDSRDNSWVDQVLDATDGKGVDVIVDQISGYVANQNLAATAIKGCIVNVGRLGGFSGEFDFDLHALRRIRYVGVTFRTRSIDEVHMIYKRMQADLGQSLAHGGLSMPLDRSYPLMEVNAALERMRANQHFGKIILSVNGS